MNQRGLTASVLFGLVVGTAAWADTLELSNGDVLQGRIVSLDEKRITFQSDILGTLQLDRARVTAVRFGDAAGTPAAQPKAGPGGRPANSVETPADVVRRLANKDFGRGAVKQLEKQAPAKRPIDPVEQLRQEGLPPGLVPELTARLPGFSSPKVQDYFGSRVQGLIQGTITLEDIRRDAKSARDQLQELRKDLGPDGAALDGYLDILNDFLDKPSTP